ncbi:hypothetical protein AWW66_25115 [Micromonospora rosaria]|uniref:ABC transporter n=1 Tax=Micromonospora rosaria TaxID=47874 RepID=A0A136PLH9_9ACTN|nr:hypothetical protein AWW66_25115 [Micromonospora rosaria]
MALADTAEEALRTPGQGSIRRIARYVRPQAQSINALLALIVTESMLGVLPPLLLQRIIDTGVMDRRPAVVTGLSMVALLAVVASTVGRFVAQWLSVRIGQHLVYRLQSDAFAHLQRLPVSFFTHTPAGVVTARITNDVLGAQGVVSGILPQVVSSVTSLVFVVGTMAYLSWPITMAALILPPLILIPAKRVGRRLRVVSHARMEAVADLSAFLTERCGIGGVLLTRLYGNRLTEQNSLHQRAARNRDLGVSVVLVGGAYATALTALGSVSVVIVYLIGGHLALAGSLSVGTLVAITALLARLYSPITSLSTARVEAMAALASFERVFELLDEPETVREVQGAPGLPPGQSEVEFDQVTFGYPPRRRLGMAGPEGTSEQVLRGVSFTIPAGRRTALVGASGSGKSTVATLLARLYDPDGGAVRIGGQDVREVSLESLRTAVGVLTQDAHLFHDTIRANLRYACPDAMDEDLMRACASVGILALLQSLPDGLDTVVGERGHRLSGGEKQRLALARLLLKEPSVVVLDEATAHLDATSEAAVTAALATVLAGRTTLVIAHRLSTVRDADDILVMSNGRIVERGTHDGLMARNGVYARLYRTQLDEETFSRGAIQLTADRPIKEETPVNDRDHLGAEIGRGVGQCSHG